MITLNTFTFFNASTNPNQPQYIYIYISLNFPQLWLWHSSLLMIHLTHDAKHPFRVACIYLLARPVQMSICIVSACVRLWSIYLLVPQVKPLNGHFILHCSLFAAYQKLVVSLSAILLSMWYRVYYIKRVMQQHEGQNTKFCTPSHLMVGCDHPLAFFSPMVLRQC